MVGMMVGKCIGVDRLAYDVYEEIFSDYFLSKDELKALMLTYHGLSPGCRAAIRSRMIFSFSS